MHEAHKSGSHDGRVAVVTGGSGAIGHAIARRLADAGARVHVMDLASPPDVNEQCLLVHRVDVRSEAEVASAFADVLKRDGTIHYLVCCAGTFRVRPFLDLSLDEWRDTLAVNLRGTFLACRAALAPMRRDGFGRMVLFSSLLARTGGAGVAHYAAAKAGVLGFARTLALEVAQEGIQVNTISPGITDTPMPRGSLSEEVLQARAAHIPLGRIGKVADMVEACLFLLDDENTFMTGQDLRLSGGATLW